MRCEEEDNSPLVSFQNFATQDVFERLAKSLEREGYCILDNVFGVDRVQQLREELESRKNDGCFVPEPSTKTNSDGRVEILTESFFHTVQLVEEESDLDIDEYPVETKSSKFPLSLSYLHSVAQRLILEMNPRIPLLELAYTIDHNKIAYSTGGASLPKHLDNDGSNARDLRKLTAILYLNPTWQPSHAGQLRIHGIDGSIRDVDPINDRMVLFWSDLIVHEVLPVTTSPQDPRYTITLWLPTKNKTRIHTDKQLYWKIIYKHFSEYL